ncbi:MAG: carboxypeptidase-like regulatory domain-containing protein [Candidatus Sulfotelmatobacter sp.]
MRKNHPAIRRFAVSLQVCFLTLLFIATCALHAQIAGQGQIQGTITDASGAVIPNATITLTNAVTRQTRVTVSNSAGTYVFPNIGIATYDLSVSAVGFTTYVQSGIVLEVGSNIAVNPTLAVGAANVKVEVHAEGTYGNISRNQFNGPMSFQLDAQVSRISPIKERLSLQARLEGFNVLNHPSLSNPSSANASAGAFGQITSQSNAARVFQGSFKVIF